MKYIVEHSINAMYLGKPFLLLSDEIIEIKMIFREKVYVKTRFGIDVEFFVDDLCVVKKMPERMV